MDLPSGNFKTQVRVLPKTGFRWSINQFNIFYVFRFQTNRVFYCWNTHKKDGNEQFWRKRRGYIYRYNYILTLGQIFLRVGDRAKIISYFGKFYIIPLFPITKSNPGLFRLMQGRPLCYNIDILSIQCVGHLKNKARV